MAKFSKGQRIRAGRGDHICGAAHDSLVADRVSRGDTVGICPRVRGQVRRR